MDGRSSRVDCGGATESVTGGDVATTMVRSGSNSSSAPPLLCASGVTLVRLFFGMGTGSCLLGALASVNGLCNCFPWIAWLDLPRAPGEDGMYDLRPFGLTPRSEGVCRVGSGKAAALLCATAAASPGVIPLSALTVLSRSSESLPSSPSMAGDADAATADAAAADADAVEDADEAVAVAKEDGATDGSGAVDAGCEADAVALDVSDEDASPAVGGRYATIALIDRLM